MRPRADVTTSALARVNAFTVKHSIRSESGGGWLTAERRVLVTLRDSVEFSLCIPFF